MINVYTVTKEVTPRGDRFHATHIETGINAISYESASKALELCKQSIKDLLKKEKPLR